MPADDATRMVTMIVRERRQPPAMLPAMVGQSAGVDVRLAELMATLSLATDLGMGAPAEQGLRAALVAARLAEAAGLPEGEARDAYYLAMLRTVGCTGDGDVARLLLGDDVGAWVAHLPNGSPLGLLAAMVGHVGRGSPAPRRAAQIARAFGGMPRVVAATRIHCEVGKKLADRLGLGPGVARGLGQMFERWDGKGQPAGLEHEQIDRAVGVAHVATDSQIMCGLGGVDAATAMVRERGGKGYAPEIAAALVRKAPVLLAALDAPSLWQDVLASEPGRPLCVQGEALEGAIRAVGEYADMKSGYFRGHSAGVSALAVRAARGLRLPEAEVLALSRAGHLHDIGRVGVRADVWEKKEPLLPSEWERIRLHAYHSERILARASFLGAAAQLASLDHERLDGSGYHRRLPPGALTVAMRVLAAADVYRALVEPRPHRPARQADEAAAELRREAREGRLDSEAVEAVLGAAGHDARRAVRPDGLSEREVEVLRLVARGLTNKEIAAALDISVKTAGHHVEHIFTKIGVTTRAAAGLYAMQNDLLADPARHGESAP